MAQKHVLICNERILFRFGVDRILVELAKKFVAEGWRVTFVCLRSDASLIRAIDAHVLTPPVRAGADLYAAEQDCADFLVANWAALNDEAPVSLVVSGGWPFFCTAFVGARFGAPSLFIDAGAVTHDGLDDNAVAPQRAVRRLRSLALPHFDRVAPISRFIAESQTAPDRACDAGVTVIPLGVDHFAQAGAATAPLSEVERALLARLRDLAARGARLVLNLGRFEPVGYKNSRASYALLRELQARARAAGRKDDVRLLLLADEAEAAAPADLAPAVICLGRASDEALAQIMELSEIGFSPSIWEGFNLPIGEMTILGKPALAFNIGAHPETIFHPWLLCSGIGEAAAKIESILAGSAPKGLFSPERIAAYRDAFSWSRALSAYHRLAEDMIAAGESPRAPEKLVLVDVTNASRDTANSGVIRVARRLSAELRSSGAARLVFLYWEPERRAYRFVNGAREALLAGYSGPTTGLGRLFAGDREPSPDELLHQAPGRASRDATLLIAEFIMDGDTGARIDWAHQRGLKTAAILYDLIPIDYPHLCGPDVRAQAPAYLAALSRVDAAIAISAYSLGRLEDYLGKRGLPLPAQRSVAWLPGQFGATPRVRARPSEPSAHTLSILCVSTVEPRKNHRTLLAAYAQARRDQPRLDLRLVLVGNAYHGAEALADEVRAAIARDPTIEWRQAVSDEELLEAARAAAFTVYPSLVEGFGLPILESLWLGKPCICHAEGVMAELAAGGGCLTVDMSDARALAQTLTALATNRSLRDRLSAEACAREIDAWPDYARHVAKLLALDPSDGGRAAGLDDVAALRARVAQDASFLQHRLHGLGLMSGVAPGAPPQIAPETRADPPSAVAMAAPARITPRAVPRAGWAERLLGARGVTVRRLRASGLFDADWYLEQYPDVREAGVDPAQHFARFGHYEGRSPGPDFDSARYRAAHPELDASGLSAFEHYLRHPRRNS